MIRHIVMWSFLDQAEGAGKQANMNKIRASLLALRPLIPEIQAMEIGMDIGIGRDTWDMVLVMSFADEAALNAYQAHPAHKAVSAFVAKVRQNRACVDFTSPPHSVPAADSPAPGQSAST
jgi:hypothetical protein